MNKLKVLSTPLPIYVTNPTANGFIANYTTPVWVAILILFLFLINAIGWGIFGVVELVSRVV